MAPPKVSGPPNPASSISTINTFGAPSGAVAPGTIVQSPTDSATVRPTVPPKLRWGIGSRVRSGLNFAMAVSSAALNPRNVQWLISATDFIGEPASACCTASRQLPGVTAMITALSAAIASPILSPRPLLNRPSMKVPAAAPAAAPIAAVTNDTGENRPTASPAPAPHLAPRRPRRLPMSSSDAIASGVLADQHRMPQREALVFDFPGQRLEVAAGRVEVLIAGHDD